MSTKALTKVQKVKSLIQSDDFKTQLQMALPSMVTPERFMRVALTTVNKTPKLAECTQASLFSCMLDCASLGVEPDGRRAHLIPYGDKCTLILDYKFLIELARRSGECGDWKAVPVCENDEFEATGEEITKHVINWREPRGEVFAVYSVFTFKDGRKSYEVMTRDEVEGIRNRSKAGNKGPWVTDWSEMAKKTIIRRHSKTLPLTPEFHDAVEKDFDALADITSMTETIAPPQRKSEVEKDVTDEVEEEQTPPVPDEVDQIEESDNDEYGSDVDWIGAVTKLEEGSPAGPIKRARKACNMDEGVELNKLPDTALQLYAKALKIEMGG